MLAPLAGIGIVLLSELGLSELGRHLRPPDPARYRDGEPVSRPLRPEPRSFAQNARIHGVSSWSCRVMAGSHRARCTSTSVRHHGRSLHMLRRAPILARRLAGTAAATTALVLAPLGTALAGASSPTTPTASGTAAGGPQCQLFTPLEGGVEQFEQAFDAGSGQSVFTGSNDIAQQMANGSGCPVGPAQSPPGGLPSEPPSGVPSGPPSGGGSSGGPQCQLFSPVEGGIEQIEQAFDSGSGQSVFTGSNDIAQQMANGSGCPVGPAQSPPGGLPSEPPSGVPSGPPSGGGSSGGPQCQLFTPLEGGVEQIEQAFDSGSGQSAFTGSNDIAQQIANGTGCPLSSSGSPSPGTSPGSGNGGGNNGAGGGGTTGGNGGSGGSGTSGSGSGSGSSAGSSGSEPGALLASSSGGAETAPTGSTLPFTGEPPWIRLAGLIALVVAAVAGLGAVGLRVAGRAGA